MRVAEFLHWNPPDQRRWQLIDGKPTPKSLANRTQGALHAEISTVLRNHLAAGARALLMSVGVIPRLRPDTNFRVADVANVSAYTTIPSVQEILVLHTTAIAAGLLRRNSDGTWPKGPIALGSGEDLVLDSIGFRAPLAAAYATTRLAPH